MKRRVWRFILKYWARNPKHEYYEPSKSALSLDIDFQQFYAMLQRSMNENQLTHTPMKRDGAAGRRKNWMTTLVIVLAAITVAGIAYSVYAWQQNRQLSNDITNKNNQIASLQKQALSTVKTPSTQTNTPTTQPSTTATYLDIKEMGIKIKLSDDIKDAVYFFDGSGPTASVSTTSLIGKGGYCDTKTTPGPLGVITERKSLSMPDGGSLTVNNATVFQVGSNYFVYTSPQAPCTQNSADQAFEMSQVASFKQALTTLQSDQ